MSWLNNSRWKVGIAIAGILLLFMLRIRLPVSAANTHEMTSGLAASVTVPVTPTEDATVTALNKKKLTNEVDQGQHTWGNWLWNNATTFLSTFFSTLVVVIGALVGLWRWRSDRRDTQDKELKDRQNEREKRAEERFQSTVTGLGDEKEGARIGAAILLRTFLRPGYEQFYTQTFDLAVANLRLPRTPNAPEDPNTPQPLTTLIQALIVVFKEAFPLARSQNKRIPESLDAAVIQLDKDYPRKRYEIVDMSPNQRNPQSLDATGIQLDNAYLRRADLREAWMPKASLRKANLINVSFSGANLSGANLSEADLRGAWLNWADFIKANLSKANLSWSDLSNINLSGANLSGANLYEADLSGAVLTNANFSKANLSGADLSEADLSEANLSDTDLSEANLSEANLSEADLKNTLQLKNANLHGVKGLTKEQLEVCNKRGAIIDNPILRRAR